MYNTALLTLVTVLYLRPPEHVTLMTESLYPLTSVTLGLPVCPAFWPLLPCIAPAWACGHGATRAAVAASRLLPLPPLRPPSLQPGGVPRSRAGRSAIFSAPSAVQPATTTGVRAHRELQPREDESHPVSSSLRLTPRTLQRGRSFARRLWKCLMRLSKSFCPDAGAGSVMFPLSLALPPFCVPPFCRLELCPW